MDSLSTEASPIWHTYRYQPKQQVVARDTQPWTTTRCHRLLRPLKTHIFALRRETQLESAELLNDDASGNGKSGTIVGPNVRKGRLQHTYSRRGRKPAGEAASHTLDPRGARNGSMSKTMKLSSKKVLQPGEIVLPTPVIRRARQQSPSPMRQPVLSGPIPPLGDRKSNCTALHLSASPGALRPSSMVSALEIEMLPLRHCISSTRFSLYESIIRALHALLVATAVPHPIRSSSTISASATKNTKSLMAMCLRKVPEYIGELEYWEHRDAESRGTKSTLQSSEASNEVYEAVENMLPSNRGCSHLRTIVREHGMRVIRDAVVEGLLDDHFALLLVALCFRTKAYLEAESLLEVVLDRSYPKPGSVDSTFDEGRRLAPLKMLRDLACESRRPQFMLRQLSKLMKLQQLPWEWLSTKEFASIWSEMVKTLSSDAVCDDTVSCAVHMITLLSSQVRSSAFALRPGKGDWRSMSQQTLISAITALTCVSFLRQDVAVSSTHSSVQSTAYAISRRIGYIIEACIHEMKRVKKPGWMPTVLGLSTYLTSATQARSVTGISELWCRILKDCNRRDGKQHYEAVTALMCSLARCCGQGAAEASHYYLIKICDKLDNMAWVKNGQSRQMRMDCAFFLAERTNDMRDLAFAESFDDITGSLESEATKNTPNKTSSTGSVPGFRWHSDISEWVTATPALPSRRLSSQPRESRRGSPEETCRDETDDDSGVSDFDASSAKRHGSYKRTPRRWTRSSATRANHCAQQQGSAIAPGARKRTLAVAGLLSLQSCDDEEEEEAEEVNKEEDGIIPQDRLDQRHRASASGQENGGSVLSVASAKKRRRVADVAVLKPRRAILRTITNLGHEDLSDDELGL